MARAVILLSLFIASSFAAPMQKLLNTKSTALFDENTGVAIINHQNAIGGGNSTTSTFIANCDKAGEVTVSLVSNNEGAAKLIVGPAGADVDNCEKEAGTPIVAGGLAITTSSCGRNSSDTASYSWSVVVEETLGFDVDIISPVFKTTINVKCSITPTNGVNNASINPNDSGLSGSGNGEITKAINFKLISTQVGHKWQLEFEPEVPAEVNGTQFSIISCTGSPLGTPEIPVTDLALKKELIKDGCIVNKQTTTVVRAPGNILTITTPAFRFTAYPDLDVQFVCVPRLCAEGDDECAGDVPNCDAGARKSRSADDDVIYV